MSEEPNNRNGNSPKGGPPDRFQPKVFLIWIGLIALIIGLWSMVSPVAPAAKQWSINDVIEAAKNDRIQKLILKPDPSAGEGYYRVSGELKRPLIENSQESFERKDSQNSPALQGPEKFQALGKLTDDRFNFLASTERSYEFIEVPDSSLMRDFLLSMVPFILIIALLYFLFVRQLRMAGKGAMNFGKSKAKMLTRDRDRITFDNVAGCDEAKQDVVEIIDFLKDPKKFQKIGGRVPKGILMVGPPGTGKTLLAKAVAGEADVPFYSISGSDFVEMFVGVGAARVRDMFEQGRKNAPCIIFIDEIDAVGRQRGAGLGGGNDEREQTLNSLLVEMDGFDAHEGVIIIAATNRPDVLDNALLRPGRFDRQVMIDLPDMNGREEVLKVHSKKIKLDEGVNLKDVARNTPGFSGADLENLLNEGALIAARRNKKRVDRFDIEEAREKIAYGTERRKLMDDEDKRMTAYHEAGHALVQVKVDDGNLPLHKVTIIPRGRALGMTMMMPKKDLLGRSKTQLLNQICMAMAGRIGEEVATGDFSNGASGDIKQATKIARHMVCDWGMSDLGPVALGDNQDHIFLGREISRNQNYSEATAHEIDKAIHDIIEKQYERAKQIIAEHKEALELTAQALLTHETIDGKHVQEILEHGRIISPIREAELQKKADDAEADEKKTASDKGEELGPGTEPAGAPA